MNSQGDETLGGDEHVENRLLGDSFGETAHLIGGGEQRLFKPLRVSRDCGGWCTPLVRARVLRMPNLHNEEFQAPAGHDLIKRGEI